MFFLRLFYVRKLVNDIIHFSYFFFDGKTMKNDLLPQQAGIWAFYERIMCEKILFICYMRWFWKRLVTHKVHTKGLFRTLTYRYIASIYMIYYMKKLVIIDYYWVQYRLLRLPVIYCIFIIFCISYKTKSCISEHKWWFH